ncbi:ethanolamine ammonia-lyase subunit EutB [Desulfotruncus alcoholivorax]|uniref:ethanolamine ammonia-lyase subunit EutB n=1 Tax=Desulfotruncus alcoholivorax TaxID=265477 RepID=UPI000420595D|nr:ethanolamine ammonia-lyase subunit EutB [Desulfotruncus alcoholivorax]
MGFKTTLLGQTFSFKTVKEVLAKANEEKSGDVLAGIAAGSAAERVAAKYVLSRLTLNELRNNPVVPYETDAVTRLIDDNLDREVFSAISNWTVAELREYILDDHTPGQALVGLSRGLTSEMVAAVTKIMSNMDLIVGAGKINIQATANTTIGVPGALASRLQPNHPTDSVAGILASAEEGLSYGVGDAVIGINPVEDSVDNISRILEALHELKNYWQIPTQICVLAHVTTQMEALRRGVPCDLVFQSLAGTEAANRSFGITVPLLEEACELAKNKGTAAGNNVMYFETGQGSELSSHSHHGADQLTLEARCYGLARHFNPFLVNTVVGFIGPEYLYDGRQVIRAGLEDHFMGKLSGLPMGVDACYTNHMKMDQNDLENLAVLLSAAGVNYFMGIPMGDDVMLNYQCTSYHDIASLRGVLGLKPLPAFEKWLEKMGLMQNGRLTRRAGDPSIFQRSRVGRVVS